MSFNRFFAVGAYVAWGGTGSSPGPFLVGGTGVSEVEVYAFSLPRFAVNSPLWQLVFRQSARGGFQAWTQGQATNATSTDLAAAAPSTATLFSQLSVLDDMQTAHAAGGFGANLTFKVRYPGMCAVAGTTCVGGRDYIIFTQSWSPLGSTPSVRTVEYVDVGGYTGATVRTAPAVFGGFVQSGTSGAALGASMVSGAQTGAYLVGVPTAPTGCTNCLPGPLSGATMLFTPAVEVSVYANVALPPACNLATNFYSVSGATATCMPMTPCTLGQTYETVAPTRFTDRTCTAVSTCWTTATSMSGQFMLEPATLVDDAVCVTLSPQCNSLSPPHFTWASATPTSDRVCAPQPLCQLPFTYQATAPTTTSAAVCLPVSTCDTDDAMVTGPTSTTDRVCGDCSGTQFVANGACVPAQGCNPGASYVTVPPIGTADRVCTPVSACQPWEYSVAPATLSTDAVCVTATNCTGLSSVATPGSTVSAATCQPRCTACTATQSMQPPATPGGCPVCMSLTPPTISPSNPVKISSGPQSLTLEAAAINVHGVDVVGWLKTLQGQLQVTQAAAVTQAANADRTRTMLEAQVRTLTTRVGQLEATVAGLLAQQ